LSHEIAGALERRFAAHFIESIGKGSECIFSRCAGLRRVAAERVDGHPATGSGQCQECGADEEKSRVSGASQRAVLSGLQGCQTCLTRNGARAGVPRSVAERLFVKKAEVLVVQAPEARFSIGYE